MKHTPPSFAILLAPVLAGTLLFAADPPKQIPNPQTNAAASATKAAVGSPAAKEPAGSKSNLTASAATQTNDLAANFPAYRPPRRGMPLARVNAGSRGSADTWPSLVAWVPFEAGYTSREQPNLYCHLNKKPDQKVVFSLVIPARLETVIAITNRADELRPGVNAIRLSDHGVKLVPGVDYQWYVALVVEPASRSQDLIAGGVIRRIVPEDDVRQRLSKAKTFDLPALYVKESLWYDAVDSLVTSIELNSSHLVLKQRLAALLAGVGLPVPDPF